jgi:hypothetical protein
MEMSLTKKDLTLIGGLLKHNLDPIKEDIKDIKETLNTHTTILDAHSKDLEILKTESVMVNRRLKIHGKWFKQIANRISIKLVEE